MAAPHIKASQQGLTSAISRIRQAKEDYDQAMRIIESTINSLDAVWDGNAQKTFKRNYEDKRKMFLQFGEEIEAYADGITAFRDDVAERDQGLAAQIAAQGG